MKKILILLATTLSLHSMTSQAAKLEDYLDRKEIETKIRNTIADQDISFGTDLANINIIDGFNLSSKYNYDVEASYINKFYTRVDKWDLSAGINVGEVLKDMINVPFSFSVSRNNSFFFVRQFPTKMEAIKALPYTPTKLPLNANLALKNLKKGDFVSMPANLNIAVGLQASTSYISPILVSGNAGIGLVMSGEFTVQVYKIDETHVRLKLITKRERDSNGTAGVGVSFNLFGIRILDHEIDRLFERDLAQYGYSYNPGAQFIVDYIFDLKNEDAKVAYNQILSSTYKFKDLVVSDMLDAKDLKDKLISSYEKADELFDADKNLDPKERRVQRIFKGFNDYAGHTRHLKFSLFITSYAKDRTFTEGKVTFIDKKEKNLEFFYPTYSKYVETHLGRGIFDLEDQNVQNNFGLIPRFNSEEKKNPDIGLTFERKDSNFTPSEQKVVEKFIVGQIPADIFKKIDFSQWQNGVGKVNSRIFFQMVLKSQGFPYLKNIPLEEMELKLFNYMKEKGKIHIVNENENYLKMEKLKDFLIINRYIQKERLIKMAESLTKILKIEETEEMLKKLVALNETGVFDKIGLGFLISLLPQDKLEDLVYVKLEMVGKDLRPISTEIGTLNYRVLYNELTQIQTRLSNRNFDLRLSPEDQNIQDLDIETLPN